MITYQGKHDQVTGEQERWVQQVDDFFGIIQNMLNEYLRDDIVPPFAFTVDASRALQSTPHECDVCR